MAGRDVVVLEREAHIGMHTSSRNSEVIHAGLYYPTNSLKASLCVQGRRMLYDYSAEKRIPHSRIGKYIIAINAEDCGRLEKLRLQAEANGVVDLIYIERDEMAGLEPAVHCERALFSPSTGIIDSHAYMLSLQADLETFGGTVVCNTAVSHVKVLSSGFSIQFEDEVRSTVTCATVVNAAGLWAAEFASRIDELPKSSVPDVHLAKGHYFSFSGKSPFSKLIYPLPGDGGLGVHVTLDSAGRTRFGPDVEWIDNVDYTFDESRREGFVSSILKYFPALDAAKLTPAYTGIRPKLSSAGQPAKDFVLSGKSEHGVAGLVNLFGIESPGLTASLAIAERVAGALD
jgi:L-2-hydroxyglutarate oxidase LhgO